MRYSGKPYESLYYWGWGVNCIPDSFYKVKLTTTVNKIKLWAVFKCSTYHITVVTYAL